jgi:hypothetical protein
MPYIHFFLQGHRQSISPRSPWLAASPQSSTVSDTRLASYYEEEELSRFQINGVILEPFKDFLELTHESAVRCCRRPIDRMIQGDPLSSSAMNSSVTQRHWSQGAQPYSWFCPRLILVWSLFERKNGVGIFSCSLPPCLCFSCFSSFFLPSRFSI